MKDPRSGQDDERDDRTETAIRLQLKLPAEPTIRQILPTPDEPHRYRQTYLFETGRRKRRKAA